MAFTPYRICPIGAHVDHNLGKLTGFAIDKGIYWEAARKHSALRPFAWIYGIARHACVMSRRGLWKRLRQDVSASRKQSDLLDRLRVRRRYSA